MAKKLHRKHATQRMRAAWDALVLANATLDQFNQDKQGDREAIVDAQCRAVDRYRAAKARRGSSKPGYGPAIKKAILLRKGIEKVPVPPPLQTFRAMYQDMDANVQRITKVQAANAVDAERIAAERWGAPLAEVKAWPCW